MKPIFTFALCGLAACWSSTPSSTWTTPTPATATTSRSTTSPVADAQLSFYTDHGLFVAMSQTDLARFGSFRTDRSKTFQLANGEIAAFSVEGDTLVLETYEFITIDPDGRTVGADSGSVMRVEGITNAASRRAALAILGLILTGVDVTGEAPMQMSSQYKMQPSTPYTVQTRRVTP